MEQLTIQYPAGVIIVEAGEEVTAEIAAALEEGRLLRKATPRYLALATAVAFVVGLLALYVFRFEPHVWNSMRRLACSDCSWPSRLWRPRGVAVFVDDNAAIGYLVPAAAFGLMTAILFDARVAVLMAVAVGSMTAIATTDPVTLCSRRCPLWRRFRSCHPSRHAGNCAGRRSTSWPSRPLSRR